MRRLDCHSKEKLPDDVTKQSIIRFYNRGMTSYMHGNWSLCAAQYIHSSVLVLHACTGSQEELNYTESHSDYESQGSYEFFSAAVGESCLTTTSTVIFPKSKGMTKN